VKIRGIRNLVNRLLLSYYPVMLSILLEGGLKTNYSSPILQWFDADADVADHHDDTGVTDSERNT